MSYSTIFFAALVTVSLATEWPDDCNNGPDLGMGCPPGASPVDGICVSDACLTTVALTTIQAATNQGSTVSDNNGMPTTTAAGTVTSRAPVTTCVDNSTYCATWKKNGFCTSTFYSPEVRQSLCAKTCGLCAQCVPAKDTNPSCSVWFRNGFCTSSFYTTEEKKKYCATTCELC